MTQIRIQCGPNDGQCAEDFMSGTVSLLLDSIDQSSPGSVEGGIRNLMFGGDRGDDLAALAHSTNWGGGNRCLTFSVYGTNWSSSTSQRDCIEEFSD